MAKSSIPKRSKSRPSTPVPAPRTEAPPGVDDLTGLTVRFPKTLLRRMRSILARRKKADGLSTSQNAWICEAVEAACRSQESGELADEHRQQQQLAEEIEKLKAITAGVAEGGSPQHSIDEAVATFRRMQALMNRPLVEAEPPILSGGLRPLLMMLRGALTPSAAREVARVFVGESEMRVPADGVELFVTSAHADLQADIRSMDLPFATRFYTPPTDRTAPFVWLFIEPERREGPALKLHLRRLDHEPGSRPTSSSDVWWVPGDASAIANVRELILHLASAPPPAVQADAPDGW